MSRKVTIKFDTLQNWRGKYADGEDGRFLADLSAEYCVTIEPMDEINVYVIMSDGLKIMFYHPGISSSYHIVREGWSETAFPVGSLVKPSAQPILESTLILEIEPSQHNSLATNTEYLIFKLPRVLNGLLVDRGRCDQETVCDRANQECIGELRGVASFMLTSRNDNLRYQCVSFRIDNLTTKKNLTKQFFCGNVLAV